MNFTNPTVLWLWLAVPIFWWLLRHRVFGFGHPKLDIHRQSSPLSFLADVPRISQCAFWMALVACLAGPVSVKHVQEPRPGALVLIQQDVSDSQQHGVTNKHELELAGQGDEAPSAASAAPQTDDHPYMMDRQRSVEGKKTVRRIDVSLAAIRLFLKHTYGNPVGLMVFDSAAYTDYPPTTNYQPLLDSLPDIEEYMLMDVQGGHGTNFDGPSGTKLDTGALQSVCDAFRGVASETVKIHIMSTDGGAEISAQRFKELASCYQKLRINLIVFGVGEEWYDSGAGEIQPLKNFVQAVRGVVVPVGNRDAFQEAVGKIDALSRASIYSTNRSQYEQNYLPWLAGAGVFFALWLVSSVCIREEF